MSRKEKSEVSQPHDNHHYHVHIVIGFRLLMIHPKFLRGLLCSRFFLFYRMCLWKIPEFLSLSWKKKKIDIEKNQNPLHRLLRSGVVLHLV